MSKITLVSRDRAREILLDSQGKFFSAIFEKTNGDIRHMVARMGVKQGIKGTGMSYDPAEKNLITVWEPKKKAYRMINLNTILYARINKQHYVFST